MPTEKVKIFDSHFHIISPGFPLYPNDGFTPDFFTTSDYLSRLKDYELIGGAVVSGSFQKQDNTYLRDALAKLGKNFVGVIQLLADTDDETILALSTSGVRAVRFNLKRGGSEDVAKIKNLAQRIYELAGWHVELYVDSTQLEPLAPTLLALPCVSIDHLGLSKSGLGLLLSLAEKGVKVKATGFGRLDFDPATAITDFYKANPDGLMFGSDLPSTRAPRPFRDKDVTLIQETLGEPGANKVLWKNAQALYLHRN
ncbi:amidohydrolase family protein [Microbulbifer sp. THAF38]|uniref:amidohydrolase family protein n=1 Tax=Microbulbifer sp. THAF38 TaxID=2587856 RepID=UPI001267EC4C|nr:amidohydrolase family protein [Microbulbifer sp. THAF38]